MVAKIPLQAIPSQKVLSVVNGQNLYFHVYQRLERMYMTLLVDDAEVFSGMICRDRLPMKLSHTQEALIGNVAFVDQEGREDPIYTGFGDNGRWILVYYADETLPDDYQTPIIERQDV